MNTLVNMRWLSILMILALLLGMGAMPAPMAAQEGQLPETGDVSQPTPQLPEFATGLSGSVSAGYTHTCALTSSGGVRCWGANWNGKVGDGTTIDRLAPVDVVGLGSEVAAVSAGEYHTCALTTGGGVVCWGLNSNGQLGNDSTIDSYSPVEVIGLSSGVIAMSMGSYHTCVLTSGGEVKCWGRNNAGQLGDGTTIDRYTPVNVVELSSGVIAISLSSNKTFAVTSCGVVKEWGAGHMTPIDVTGLPSGVVAIAPGKGHQCVLTSGGGVKCWGGNTYGQLGDGTTIYRPTPVDVVGLTSDVIAIVAGEYHTCALTSSGGMKCWGDNWFGQLGDGTNIIRLTPVDVYGLINGVSAVSTRHRHTCALSSGEIKCWGDNMYGQLGNGVPEHHETPVDVVGLTNSVSTVSSGYMHTCAIISGVIKCWGNNLFGQLGDGTITDRLTPVDVVGLPSGMIAVSAGALHTCALSIGGGVKCWGYNSYGQLGDGTTENRLIPVDVVGLESGAASVSAGYDHTCVTKLGGGIKCWGRNNYGQIGDGTTDNRLVPVVVSGQISSASEVNAGNYHTCALTSGGGIKCWGGNWYGQLGDDTATDRLTPVDVIGLSSGVYAISAGGAHTCAVTSYGGLKCWGANHFGQLGDGTTDIRLTPVDVDGLNSDTNMVSTGYGHSCARTSSEGIKCWGLNEVGQLGDGTKDNRLTPVNVIGLLSSANSIDNGGYHTCTLSSGGGAKCWGDNWGGQLGNGEAGHYLYPMEVIWVTQPVYLPLVLR